MAANTFSKKEPTVKKQRFSFVMTPTCRLFALVDSDGDVTFSIRRYTDSSAPQSVDAPAHRQVDLSVQRWKTLMMKTAKINCALENGEKEYAHLGSHYYVVADETFVHIRRFYYNFKVDKLLPTKEGVAFNHFQWKAFCDLLDPIANSHVPEVRDARACFHQSQKHMMACGECSPEGPEDCVPEGYRKDYSFADQSSPSPSVLS